MEIVIENPSESTAGAPTTPEAPLSTSVPDCSNIPAHPFHRTRAATFYDSEYNYNYGHEYNYSPLPSIHPNLDVYRGPVGSQRFRRASTPSGDLDGATVISVRRVDKSGLLEISEVCPVSGDWQRQVPGMDTVPGHTSIPRRIDRTGLLEAVPEDRCSPCLEDDSEANSGRERILEESRHLCNAESTSRIRESLEQARPRLSSFETLARNTLRRLTKTSVDQQSVNDPSIDGKTSVETFSMDSTSFRLGGTVASSPLVMETSISSPIERRDGGKDTTAIKLEEISLNSPLPSRDRENRLDNISKAPDLIESTLDSAQDRIQSLEKKDEPPEGERAEAEGCEHSAIEDVEERRSSKNSNDPLRGDNVQTLRVIILSEQL